MRSLLLCLVLVTVPGCVEALGPPVLATMAAVVPPVVGITAVPLEGSMHATVGGVSAGGKGEHPGGWGVSLDTSSGGVGYLAHGKIELGRWGRDRFYGSSGAEAGFGMVQGGYGGGILFGYGYGGHVQNAHQAPIKLMGFAHAGPINLRLSGYAGWRFGERDEYPHGSTWGPGWNMYGAELSTILLVKGGGGGGAGVSFAVAVDRQDDLNITWLKIGLGVGVVGK